MKAEDKTRREMIDKLAEMQRRLSKQVVLKTEIDRARERVQELKEKYEALRDRSHLCVYVHDFEGKFLDANRAFLNLLGYENEEIPSLSLATVLAGDQLPEALKSLEQIKQSGAQTKAQLYKMRKKDGEDLWVEAEGAVLYRVGKPYAIQMVAVNITEGKRIEQELREQRQQFGRLVEERTAELKKAVEQLRGELEKQKGRGETLRKSEERYRRLVEQSPLGSLIIQGLPPVIVFANRVAGEILGHTAAELMSLSPEDVRALVHPQDLSRLLTNYRDVRGEKGMAGPWQTRIICKDGTERWVEIFCSMENGEGTGVQIYFFDITESKEAKRDKAEKHQREEERGTPKAAGTEQPEAQLFQAQELEAIVALAGKVAHDFNELLTSIQEHLDLALRKIDQKSPLYRDLKRVEEVSMEAANLASQLLLFSGQQPMEFVTINLNRTVKILSKMLDRLIGKDITLVTNLGVNLWSVNGDVASIEQVIVNLATNARDAMPEGGKLQMKTENVTLGDSSHGHLPGARSGKFVCLSVTDTGMGMGKATVDRIFEPFFSTKRHGGRAGLGLSVVYGVVKQHKGWIDVISEPGRGTTFKIYLPAHFTGDQDEGEAESGEQRPHGRGQRVLLVENEGAVRGFAARELVENGYVVFEASTAEGALDIFEGQKGDFHLVLTDIILPNKNGLQLVDQLRSRNPQLPVLLSSSHTADKSQWPIVRRKGFRFLRKPFTSAELLQAVKETIEQAR